VEWNTRTPHRSYWFSVYALSSFEDSEPDDDPSPLALELLQHIFTSLPLDYFLRVQLFTINPHRCPVHLAMAFLSIIPQDAHWNHPEKEPWTEFIVDFTFSEDDLRTILSHPFHPAIKLSFSVSELASMSDSVSMGAFIELLRDAPHLRAVALPRKLVEAHCSSDLPVFGQVVFTTPTLFIFYEDGKMSPLWLHTIARAHSVTELAVVLALYCWGEEWPDELRSCIQLFFKKDDALERLSIWLNGWTTQPKSKFRAAFRQINRRMANVMPACASRKLDSVNVAVCLANGQPDRLDTTWENNSWNVERIKEWDEVLFPSLAVNFCQNRFQILAKGGVIPLAIKAINEGIIYQKTTHHVPFDASAANASAIFLFVKTDACRVLHDDAAYGSSPEWSYLDEEVLEQDALEVTLGGGGKRLRT
jgi:hypothetical protein